MTEEEQKRATLTKLGAQLCEECHVPIGDGNRGTDEVDLSGGYVGRRRHVLCKGCTPPLTHPCPTCGKSIITLCFSCTGLGQL